MGDVLPPLHSPFETRKKVTAPRQDITGSPDIYSYQRIFLLLTAGQGVNPEP